MKLLITAFCAASMLLAGCATNPKDFYADPTKPKDTALCRAVLETTDTKFQHDAAIELTRRGLTWSECQNKVAMETAVILGIAAVGTGVAVAAACRNGCSAPSYAPSYRSSAGDYDCAGGPGDGPYYVRGPFPLTGPDIYNLDRDHDGIACEPHGDRGA
jgi:hypothetical protein